MATRSTPSAWELVTLGGTITGCVVGGLLVGWLVDRAAHTLPVCSLIGLGLGIVAGCFVLYGRIRSYLS